jgi:hypothetical protein
MTTSLWSRAGRLWCTMMHGKSMWPMRGYYRCSVCLRSYPVQWSPYERSSGERSRVRHRMEGAVPEGGRFAVAPSAFARRDAKLAETAQ